MGKRKITKTPATDETIIKPEEFVTVAGEVPEDGIPTPEQIAEFKAQITKRIIGEDFVTSEQLATPQTPLPQTEKGSILKDAPELYGNNPTAEQIEAFKQRELIWRRKLESI